MKKAYCPELDRLVTISEVWELLYGPQKQGKKLTFQCSDEACRVPLTTRNCYSYGIVHDACFRIFCGQDHQTKCKALRESKRQKSEALKQRRKNVYRSFSFSGVMPALERV